MFATSYEFSPIATKSAGGLFCEIVGEVFKVHACQRCCCCPWLDHAFSQNHYAGRFFVIGVFMSRPRFEGFCWLGLLRSRIGGGLPLLLLLPWGASLSAAPILLLNQQTTATVSIAPGMGHYAGWKFAERVAGTSPWDNPSLNQAYLQVGGWSSITASANVEQGVNATTTLTYDIPGFAITRISLFGFAYDGGNVAGESMRITAPCNAGITGNGLPSQQYCWPTTSAQQITASLRMYTDVTQHSGSANVGPLMLTLQLTPLIHNPEPTTMLLIGGGVGVLLLLSGRGIR